MTHKTIRRWDNPVDCLETIIQRMDRSTLERRLLSFAMRYQREHGSQKLEDVFSCELRDAGYYKSVSAQELASSPEYIKWDDVYQFSYDDIDNCGWVYELEDPDREGSCWRVVYYPDQSAYRRECHGYVSDERAKEVFEDNRSRCDQLNVGTAPEGFK